MLERIVAAVAFALFEWLGRRIERNAPKATDAIEDVESMRRAGARLREWMRAEDRPRQ